MTSSTHLFETPADRLIWKQHPPSPRTRTHLTSNSRALHAPRSCVDLTLPSPLSPQVPDDADAVSTWIPVAAAATPPQAVHLARGLTTLFICTGVRQLSIFCTGVRQLPIFCTGVWQLPVLSTVLVSTFSSSLAGGFADQRTVHRGRGFPEEQRRVQRP